LLWLLNETGAIQLPAAASTKQPEREYAENVPLSAVLNKIEKGKAEIENVYTNNMPFYMNLVGFIRDMERSSQELLLRAVGAPAPEAEYQDSDLEIISEEWEEEPEPFDASIYKSVKIGSDANNHDYYFITPGDFIEGAVNLGQDALKDRATAQAAAINRIGEAAMRENADVYVYNVSRMQDFDYFAEIVKGTYSTRQFRDYFRLQLNPDISFRWLDLSTVEKSVKKIYRTDHHWSPEGTYDGYVDVINMMREKRQNIGDPYPMGNIITAEGVQWRGYYSALTAYSALYVDFTVLDIESMNLPPHKMSDANGRSYEYRHHEYFVRGRFPKDTYFGHYNHYHGQQYRVSYPENKTGKNLLWIGDSMTYSIARLIAAHFDETYMLYPWEASPVDLEEYMKEHKITDVLFLIFSDRLMFNMYNDCDFSRFRTRGDR